MLLFNDIDVTVTGIETKVVVLLLSDIKEYNPSGNVLVNIFKLLFEQFKYDNDNGRFNDVNWLKEQFIYDIDLGKSGKDAILFWWQSNIVKDDDLNV